MPQLNPSPWLYILVFSWLIFLTIVPQKVMAHQFPEGMTPSASKSFPTLSWSWPWL